MVNIKLHHMTLYTGMYRITAMGLLYKLTIWSIVYLFLYLALDPIVVLTWAPCLNEGHGYRRN
jgi:hypothetical protein